MTGTLEEFAKDLSAEAVTYSDEEFLLHSGDRSNWIIDCKLGLCFGPKLQRMGQFMVVQATYREFSPSRIAGYGLGGMMVAHSLLMAYSEILGKNLSVFTTSDEEINAEINTAGALSLSRGRADNKDELILAVDDIATTGRSLIELIEILKEDGAKEIFAAVIGDRSEGAVADIMAEMDVPYFALFQFDEEHGLLVPSGN